MRNLFLGNDLNLLIQFKTFLRILFDYSLIKEFIDLLYAGIIRPRPPVPTYAATSLEISGQVGAVIMGQMTPDQAIDAAAKASLEEWERTAR